MGENDLKLAGTSLGTKDYYDFNVVNANEAMLLTLQLTSAFCAQVDFIQVGGPFREVGGADYPGSIW